MPNRPPSVHLLLKDTPSTLAEYRAWLLKLIDAWHVYMGRGSVYVSDAWCMKLWDCVERAGLHADCVGLRSLLGERPSRVADDLEETLRYLRLCQQTAEAAMSLGLKARVQQSQEADAPTGQADTKTDKSQQKLQGIPQSNSLLQLIKRLKNSRKPGVHLIDIARDF